MDKNRDTGVIVSPRILRDTGMAVYDFASSLNFCKSISYKHKKTHSRRLQRVEKIPEQITLRVIPLLSLKKSATTSFYVCVNFAWRKLNHPQIKSNKRLSCLLKSDKYYQNKSFWA
jgi:hypothetical protein